MFITKELIVKKSRFVSHLIDLSHIKIENVNAEVKSIINNFKIKNKKASHVIYGFIYNKNNTEIIGFSDDKEPKNTAGKPIYELLKLKNKNNLLIVIVRFYGGIKLGSGGLIKAYRQSANLLFSE